ncbi:MAG: RusA family crossover junction endodeoxyribonuclease [Planctomycetes bacterium]|jgi:Holliday junction resolvase RusA-like endonuclease|nr:RusA family crossover junction endodeoxyribonuclease [Planctomycetota bacterium]MCL4731670.1 RusA family crossover junction endodeoxyribonuclease [Planctomycetota bacterium]
MDRSRPARISASDFRALLAGRKAVPRARAAHRAFKASPRGAGAAPLCFVLPFLPPSVNRLFATVRDRATGALRRVLTAEARRIRRLILALVQGNADPDRLYELRIDVHLRAFCADGSVRRVDLTNRVKFLEDCLCGALGIDDSRIFRVVLNKVHADEEQTRIELHTLAEPSGPTRPEAP